MKFLEKGKMKIVCDYGIFNEVDAMPKTGDTFTNSLGYNFKIVNVYNRGKNCFCVLLDNNDFLDVYFRNN